MEGDRHFSHPHPLASFVDEMEADVSDNFHSCKICGLPILSAPSYTCTFAACDFFLHESCAHKFHQKFIHPNHRPRYNDHTLRLEEGSPNFTYQCEDCNNQMHPLTAAAVFGVEIKSKHKSHPPHPLVALRRQILSPCDCCGEKHEGFFFSCHLCDFWIHQDCTILPTTLILSSDPEPYLLAYSIPVHVRNIECIVCDKPLRMSHNAIYFCPQTMRFSHVKCGLQKIQSKTRLELIQLPDDELDTFPSFEILTYSHRNHAHNIGDEDKKLAMENVHKHPLILVGDEEEDHNYYYKKLVCDLCTQTITIPSQFYRCAQQGCSFFAHKVCADLLPILKFEFPNDVRNNACKGQPCPYPDKWYFSSIFFCIVCFLPSNAACYHFPGDDLDSLMIDLSCMAAPSIIKHSSHSQYLLFRTSRHSRAYPLSCCSRGTVFHDVYRCTNCDFYIHIRCALLPKRVHFRKFDQHPLHLITSNSIGSDQDICEVCEEGIECKYWFYHCAKCDYSFHVNCIPSLGYLSKVKFGGKLDIPCHSHPLTLTRMLAYGRNEKCGHCHKIIPGLVDQAAFSCSQCDYLIHFSCARDSFTSSHNCTSSVFEEVNKPGWYDIAEE
ncbi:hypothetical protein SASPL_149474 [Salvia splendens]|uniref:Phorbol-ester/DAG-type domain-containing protein n=1 Tax=Salvia splendens TaxID=180675 RepID=A0A8X8WBR7_SALSN|nr:uncharacterized protein LOC121778667 [Salvia splendens]KAG6391716.1 hypothetical protein SASPL_149474 [Salvia splendens]